MSTNSSRFVLLPSYVNLTREGLKIKDLLVYLTIRSFNNSARNICRPSILTIAETADLSRPFVIKSIKRLENAGYLTVNRSTQLRVAHNYEFKELIAYTQIPYEIFNVEDLTPTEAATLICLRQCFNSYSLEMMHSLNEATLFLDISYRALYKQYSSLVKKGYIEKFEKKKHSGRIVTGVRLTGKLNWLTSSIERALEAYKEEKSKNKELSVLFIG